jgi:hypothetical protein
LKGSWLTSYWITSPSQHGPFGYGVTAFSLEEALRFIRAEGFGLYLPDNLAELSVIENITFQQLDQNNVVPNMGPMVIRGMWYPCRNIGWVRRFT